MTDEQQTLLEQDEKEFFALIQRLKNIKRYREFLLGIDFDDLKKFSPWKYWQTFFNLYKGFCFFPDDEIKAKLKSLGLTEEDLIYFTPLDEILNELNKIWANVNIIPVKKIVLQSIKQHYDIKINTVIIKQLGFTTHLNGKKDATKFKKILYNIKRRRDDDRKGGLKSFRTPLDELAYTSLLALDKINDSPTENQDFMIALSDGNTKPLLLKIIESHYYQNMTKDSFLRKFYFLFRLIIKEGPDLPNEECFYDFNTYLEKSFATFQTIKVKDIVY